MADPPLYRPLTGSWAPREESHGRGPLKPGRWASLLTAVRQLQRRGGGHAGAGRGAAGAGYAALDAGHMEALQALVPLHVAVLRRIALDWLCRGADIGL